MGSSGLLLNMLLVLTMAWSRGLGKSDSLGDNCTTQDPASLAVFIGKQTTGSLTLCLSDDMSADVGSLEVKVAQSIGVVGSSSGHPRFVGRFVLDDHSGAELLLQRVTMRDRNASTVRGCLGSSAAVQCLGAAVWVGDPATLTATDSIFSSLSSADGGAIYARGGTVLLQRVVFVDNHADFSGGAIFTAFTPALVTIVDSFFGSNSAGRLGGAILAWNSSSFRVCNSSFADNTAPGIEGDPGGSAIARCAPGCRNETFMPTRNGDNVDIGRCRGAPDGDG